MLLHVILTSRALEHGRNTGFLVGVDFLNTQNFAAILIPLDSEKMQLSNALIFVRNRSEYMALPRSYSSPETNITFFGTKKGPRQVNLQTAVSPRIWVSIRQLRKQSADDGWLPQEIPKEGFPILLNMENISGQRGL